MFDIGWQELALTGVVALVVLGPKELPGLMRTAGQLVRKARLLAHDLRLNMEELAEEAEIEEYRQKALAKATAVQPPVPPPAEALPSEAAAPLPPEVKKHDD